MNIEIVKDNKISTPRTNFYTVYLNGEIVLECLSESEMQSLTIKDIMDITTY